MLLLNIIWWYWVLLPILRTWDWCWFIMLTCFLTDHINTGIRDGIPQPSKWLIFELCSLSCCLIVGFRYALVLEFTLCNSKLNWTNPLLSWKPVLLWKCFQGASHIWIDIIGVVYIFWSFSFVNGFTFGLLMWQANGQLPKSSVQGNQPNFFTGFSRFGKNYILSLFFFFNTKYFDTHFKSCSLILLKKEFT